MDFREEKNIKRNDFLQLLIQLKNKGKLEDVDEGLTEKEKEKSDSKCYSTEYIRASLMLLINI